MFTELTFVEQQNIYGGDIGSDLWDTIKTTGEVVTGAVLVCVSVKT